MRVRIFYTREVFYAEKKQPKDYASRLAEAGVDIKTAQYLLGHSDIKMTVQIYTHVTPKMLESAREKINAMSK